MSQLYRGWVHVEIYAENGLEHGMVISDYFLNRNDS